MDTEQIYDTYYKNSGVSRSDFTKAWGQIADSLHLPSAKLRPTDRFGKDIGVYLFLSEDLDKLSNEARKQLAAVGKKINLAELKTVDNYVRCFSSIPRNIP